MRTKFSTCTILRVKRAGKGATNSSTRQMGIIQYNAVAEPCASPLFLEEERATGICNFCRAGWETDGNAFASNEEKKRAMSGTTSASRLEASGARWSSWHFRRWLYQEILKELEKNQTPG